MLKVFKDWIRQNVMRQLFTEMKEELQTFCQHDVEPFVAEAPRALPGPEKRRAKS